MSLDLDEINELLEKILKKADEDELRALRTKFWLSIRRANKCLFSRRNGYIGKLILGYSVCLRLFNRDIL